MAPQSIGIGNDDEVCVLEAAAVACCRIDEWIIRGGREEIEREGGVRGREKEGVRGRGESEGV